MSAPAAAPVRQEPTDAQLRAAWAHVKRSTWPDTFEEAMEHATLSRLVRLTALHPAPARAFVARGVPATSPRPAAPAAAPPPARHHFLTPPPGIVDQKRLAAGDRDDD
jgi:hypothetical protein